MLNGGLDKVPEDRRMRVAVYARVSTGGERQDTDSAHATARMVR
jgi:hypothetical protein